ncbi:uncharacterized protein LOC105195623 [Solenopsis invicta]|uniref:uncharacterized protein LOC105195623 n=1 Tax=Solenopsis invicta TaxID=13686 RepID=UPI000595E4CE|nr:uncharacterized protein LOC105195623 [Solenopsis invicta]
MVRTLFFLGTAFFAFAKIHAAPTRYDQRQDGDFNLHTKFENILFVVVFPSNAEKITNAAWNALDSVISRSKDQGLIKADEEPFSVEIINVNHPNKESSVRKAEGGELETSNVSDQQPTSVEDKADRIARNVKNFDFPKSREVPTVPGYFVNVRKTPALKMGNGGRARNVVGNVWNPDDEPGQLETSLKKQLPQREENVASQSSESVDKNDVSLVAEEKQQELRLLGDSIENCGPGRHRDASGICQSDGSTASLL